jgi:hypothetical protein
MSLKHLMVNHAQESDRLDFIGNSTYLLELLSIQNMNSRSFADIINAIALY